MEISRILLVMSLVFTSLLLGGWQGRGVQGKNTKLDCNKKK